MNCKHGPRPKNCRAGSSSPFDCRRGFWKLAGACFPCSLAEAGHETPTDILHRCRVMIFARGISTSTTVSGVWDKSGRHFWPQLKRCRLPTMISCPESCPSPQVLWGTSPLSSAATVSHSCPSTTAQGELRHCSRPQKKARTRGEPGLGRFTFCQ